MLNIFILVGKPNVSQAAATCSLYDRRDSPALKMEAILSSETSVLIKTTRHQIPEDDFLRSHCRENFKSYITLIPSLSVSMKHTVSPGGRCYLDLMDPIQEILYFYVIT
jgi:hypothetical protein